MEHEALSAAEEVEAIEGVHLALLSGDERANVQHFRIEPGATVPEHDHRHEQVGFVYEGTLTFLVGGEAIQVGPGESFALAGGEPHGAENRGDVPARGVDVFSPPRYDPDWTA